MKKGLWAVIVVITSVITGVALAEERMVAKESAFGCTDQGYYGKIIGFAAQKDRVAFEKELLSGMTTGRCTMFKSGEAVFLEDVKIMSGVVKLRRKGETTSYWTDRVTVN